MFESPRFVKNALGLPLFRTIWIFVAEGTVSKPSNVKIRSSLPNIGFMLRCLCIWDIFCVCAFLGIAVEQPANILATKITIFSLLLVEENGVESVPLLVHGSISDWVGMCSLNNREQGPPSAISVCRIFVFWFVVEWKFNKGKNCVFQFM